MSATLFEGVTRDNPEGVRFRREAQVQGARLQKRRAVARQRPAGRSPKMTRRALLAELSADPARRAAP